MWKKKERGEKLLNLSPESILPRPVPIRQGSDEEIARLTESVGRYGVLEPLTVRAKGGQYELILGARRLTAARAAGLERVPCRVIVCTQRQAVELALEENRKRAPLTLFEEAEALEKLLTHYRVDRGEAALRLGLSRSALTNKLRLLKFSRDERRTIVANCLSERCARTLLRLSEDEERAAALSMVVDRGYTARQAENLVEAMLERPEEFVRTPQSFRTRLPAAPEPRRAAPRRASRPARKLIVKDVRLFLNSVDKVIYHMKEAGVKVEAEKEEAADCYTYRIRVEK